MHIWSLGCPEGTCLALSPSLTRVCLRLQRRLAIPNPLPAPCYSRFTVALPWCRCVRWLRHPVSSSQVPATLRPSDALLGAKQLRQRDCWRGSCRVSTHRTPASRDRTDTHPLGARPARRPLRVLPRGGSSSRARVGRRRHAVPSGAAAVGQGEGGGRGGGRATFTPSLCVSVSPPQRSVASLGRPGGEKGEGSGWAGVAMAALHSAGVPLGRLPASAASAWEGGGGGGGGDADSSWVSVWDLASGARRSCVRTPALCSLLVHVAGPRVGGRGEGGRGVCICLPFSPPPSPITGARRRLVSGRAHLRLLRPLGRAAPHARDIAGRGRALLRGRSRGGGGPPAGGLRRADAGQCGRVPLLGRPHAAAAAAATRQAPLPASWSGLG